MSKTYKTILHLCSWNLLLAETISVWLFLLHSLSATAEARGLLQTETSDYHLDDYLQLAI